MTDFKNTLLIGMKPANYAVRYQQRQLNSLTCKEQAPTSTGGRGREEALSSVQPPQ